MTAILPQKEVVHLNSVSSRPGLERPVLTDIESRQDVSLPDIKVQQRGVVASAHKLARTIRYELRRSADLPIVR